MPNSLFNQFGRQQGNHSPMRMLQQFNKFRRMFQGNPEQVLQRMLTSGHLKQEQYDEAYQAANDFMPLLNGFQPDAHGME